MKKIAIIVNTPSIARVFLYHHISELTKKYKVTLITNTFNQNLNILDNLPKNIEIKPLRIERKIHLLKDLNALISLYKIFIDEKFDTIHSISPKAGLLSHIAGYFANIEIRIHTFTGQIWANKKGIFRKLFKLIDKLIVLLSNNILIDSHSQKKFLIKENIVKKENSYVLASGSLSGVDLDRFYPSKEVKKDIRKKLNININDIILLYVGRLNKDKGIIELLLSFKELRQKYKFLNLVIVGEDEINIDKKLKEILNNNQERIFLNKFSKYPEYFMMASDILILPSFREGFGSVVIEAGACQIPSIVSKIYGLNDSIIENETGLFFTPGNVKDLIIKIEKLLINKQLRKKMGKNSLIRSKKIFSNRLLTQALLNFYESKI